MAMVDVSGLRRRIERVRRVGVDELELDHHRRHVPRLDLHHVLPCLLVFRHRQQSPDGLPRDVALDGIAVRRHAIQERSRVRQLLHLHRLEVRQMKVQGVVVLRQVDHFPHFCAPRSRRLRRRVQQWLPVDIQMRRFLGRAIVLVERDITLDGRLPLVGPRIPH